MSEAVPGMADADRPLVDAQALSSWLDGRLPGEGAFEVERHQAGHSNETFFVRRSGHEWVLRRPPRGAFLPTAHDVLREHRVLTAVAASPTRAPRPVLACEDEAVIGVPFFLMESVRGVVVREALPDALDDERERRRIGEEMIDALAELHAVDWRTVGLEGWGKPSGYLERQVRRWAASSSSRRGSLGRFRTSIASARGSRRSFPTRARRRSCTATTSSTTSC